MACASDKNVHGPYSTSPHSTLPPMHCPSQQFTYMAGKGPFQLHMVPCIVNPSIQKSEAGGSLNGSRPDLHREVQDSWNSIGPVSKKNRVLPVCLSAANESDMILSKTGLK